MNSKVRLMQNKSDSQLLSERVALTRAIGLPTLLAFARVFALFGALDFTLSLSGYVWSEAATLIYLVRFGVGAWFFARFVFPAGYSLFMLRNRIIDKSEAGREGERRAIVDFYWTQLGRDISLTWRMWRA